MSEAGLPADRPLWGIEGCALPSSSVKVTHSGDMNHCRSCSVTGQRAAVSVPKTVPLFHMHYATGPSRVRRVYQALQQNRQEQDPRAGCWIIQFECVKWQ